MINALLKVPVPSNEPIRTYAPGTAERKVLLDQLDLFLKSDIEIPLIIGGKEIRTGNLSRCVCPHDHQHVLGRFHRAGKREVELAIRASAEAWPQWSSMNWAARASIFLKAAELLATRYRSIINAATMLNMSKNVYQAEIDAACELIDFLRYNVFFKTEIYSEQPGVTPGCWNFCEYRPLEGFIFAVSPFNFTSVAANLSTSAAIMGNVVIWKPASLAVYAGYFVMKLLMEAGLPPGVINFVPGSGADVGHPVMSNRNLAGVHFTGSTATFRDMWRTIGENIACYRTYPRIVGETGGKDFVFVHASADPAEVATALSRGAFEYQGQKCSAASRAYIPESIWPQIRSMLLDQVASFRMGDVCQFGNFINAVIDAGAFASISSYIGYAKKSSEAEILIGGGADDRKGYFIEPTVVLTSDPAFKLMQEEIFGPVLTIFVYKDADFCKTLELCDETSPYGLTGSIFARDRIAIMAAYKALRYSAGNFYINDKPTGAVVGQQPFGGGRTSGTNEKAGSKSNLLRWVNIRTVKENFCPPQDYRYPFLADD